MTQTMKDLVRAAKANLREISPEEAHAAAAGGDIILDVRESGELEKDGRIEGALHIPRGILESRACTDMETKDTELCAARDDRQVHVLCASGARAALAADTLRNMGYQATVIAGGLKAWKDAGLEVEHKQAAA